MPTSVAAGRRYGTSPRADRGGERLIEVYRQLCGSASEEAAKQKLRRTIRDYIALIRCFAMHGAGNRIARQRQLFELAARDEALCTTDACLREAIREEHHRDQLQDTARLHLTEAIAAGESAAQEEHAIRTLQGSIAAQQRKLQILLDRQVARHG